MRAGPAAAVVLLAAGGAATPAVSADEITYRYVRSLRPPGRAVGRVTALAVDERNGRVLVLEPARGKVLAFDRVSGRYLRSLDLPEGLAKPIALAVGANGDVYIGDAGRKISLIGQTGYEVKPRVVRLSRDGKNLGERATWSDDSTLDDLRSLAVDAATGEVYALVRGWEAPSGARAPDACRVLVFAPDLTPRRSIPRRLPAHDSGPDALAAAPGGGFWLNYATQERFDRSGRVRMSLAPLTGDHGWQDAIATDGAGRVLIAERKRYESELGPAIYEYGADRVYVRDPRRRGRGIGTIRLDHAPYAVAADRAGRVYVTVFPGDTRGWRVQVYAPAAPVSRVFAPGGHP